MNIGKVSIDLAEPSNNTVVRIAQKIIPAINGEPADDVAGALVTTLVVLGKQTGAFTKADALLALEQTWEAIECAPSA